MSRAVEITAEIPFPACPACQGTELVHENAGTHPLIRCRECSLLFRDPQNMASILEANVEAFDAMPRGWWETLYDDWNARERGRDLPHTRPAARALEIGPGRGAFIGFLLEKDYRVEGIDISQAICIDLGKRYGVKMTCGTLDGFQEKGPYDLVAAHHVVEHLQDPSSFFRMCRLLLVDGGRLLVSCPNTDSWAAAFSSWAGYEPYHAFFFTPESMAGLLWRNGFSVSRVRTWQLFTGWWNVLFRSVLSPRRPSELTRYGRNKAGTSLGFLFNVIRFAGSTLLLPLTIVTKRLARGEELVILAEKKEGRLGAAGDARLPL